MNRAAESNAYQGEERDSETSKSKGDRAHLLALQCGSRTGVVNGNGYDSTKQKKKKRS